jgi:DNA-binding GntR family transcriptional regulator
MPRRARWLDVYERLRRRILTLQIPPGTRMSETGLAAEFGTSSTPVRDALGRLCQEGLVITGGERGYWVSPLAISDLRELSDVRFVLERGACEMVVAQRVNLAVLARRNDAIRSAGKRDAVVDANIGFHVGLAELTTNGHLAAMLRQVLEESARFFRLGLDEISADDIHAEHARLLDALAGGDVDAVVRIIRDDVYGTRDRVARLLLTQPAAGPLRMSPPGGHARLSPSGAGRG